MKRYIRCLGLLCAFLAGMSLPGLADGTKTLESFRAAFEKRLNAELDAHGKAARELRTKYLNALTKLKGDLGRAENLKGAAQVVAEIEAIEDGEEPKELPGDADFKLKRVRTQWERGLDEIQRQRARKLSATVALYLKALDTEKRKLTRAGKIKDALLFEEEAKRVNDLPEVRAARPGEEDPVGEPDGPEDLSSFLPGRTYTFHREGRPSRQVRFEEKGRARFLDDQAMILRWRVKKGTRELSLTHRNFTADVELVFSEDGKKYKGVLVGIGKRWGEIIEEK